jgi:hypothetical protein
MILFIIPSPFSVFRITRSGFNVLEHVFLYIVYPCERMFVKQNTNICLIIILFSYILVS